MARLSPAYYANPVLLHDAQSPTLAAAGLVAERLQAPQAREFRWRRQASLLSAGVAMAWLAIEDGSQVGITRRVRACLSPRPPRRPTI